MSRDATPLRTAELDGSQVVYSNVGCSATRPVRLRRACPASGGTACQAGSIIPQKGAFLRPPDKGDYRGLYVPSGLARFSGCDLTGDKDVNLRERIQPPLRGFTTGHRRHAFASGFPPFCLLGVLPMLELSSQYRFGKHFPHVSCIRNMTQTRL